MIEKNGSRWLVVLVVLGLAGWASFTNLPLNLGIDLSGGSTLTYSIDPKTLAEISRSGGDATQQIEQAVSIIATRIDSLGVRDLSTRREGADHILIQAPKMTKEEAAEIRRRMVQLGKLEFLIGLGDLDQSRPERDVSVPSASAGVKENYRFVQATAEAKRQVAITAGKEAVKAARAAGKSIPPDAYRDGTTFELKAEDGRGLGIYWKPRTPHEVAKELAISEDQARLSIQQASDGDEYNAAHIKGGWLYADPEFFGPGLEGFTGEDIRDPQKSVGTMNELTVVYKVKPLRQPDFESYTSRYVGWPLCLVLNDEIWSSPVIEEKLRDNVQIRGSFTREHQDFLINCLQSGSLKLRPRLENEEDIAATLGEKSIGLGVMSTLISAILIFGFAIVYYRTSGLIAVISLVLNLLLTLATMLLFRSTLTLPGIAGLTLTLGMAIDANILIFERIREELDKGKSLLASVQTGFDRAFITIVDSNLTTLITAILLYKFGVGPIRGFAVTLIAGLLCSIFTACFVSKTLFATLIRSGAMKSIKYLRLVPTNLNIKFLDRSKAMLTLSAIMIIVSIVAFAFSGDRKYGLDFTGGYSVRLNLAEPMSANDLGDRLRNIKNDQGATKYAQINTTALSDSKSGDGYKSFDLKVQSLKGATATEITARLKTDLTKALGAEILREIRNATFDEASDEWQLEFTLAVETGYQELESRVGSVKDEFGREPYQSAAFEAVSNARKDLLTNDLFATSWRIGVNEKSILGHEVISDLSKALAAKLPNKPEGGVDFDRTFEKMSYVGPNVVHNLKSQATIAVILSLLANILYIWFRFKEVKYGLAAVIAVFHDAIISIGLVVIGDRLGLIHAPIDLPIIAGVLTVMGYSLNDTIVIFDRMRENLGNVKGSFRDVLNHSINQTLDRTILTALTTFFSVLVLFVLNYGQESGIEGISFIMLTGVIVGTYSTIYIATPVVLWLHNREVAKNAAKSERPATSPSRAGT